MAQRLLIQPAEVINMMTKNLQRKVKNTGLVLSLAFGFLITSVVTVKAQYRNDDNRRNDDNYRREQERERRHEEYHRRDGRRENRRNDDSYGNNGGYNRNDDYDRNGGYGNGGYNNNFYRIAQQNGYNDGLRKGAEDARERHNNPQGTSEYKRATNGYDSSYRDKEGYKQAYRQAFLQGFDEGQNRSYNNGRYGNRNGNRNRSSNGAGSIFRRIITGY